MAASPVLHLHYAGEWGMAGIPLGWSRSERRAAGVVEGAGMGGARWTI
jgi:hypothetical protein